MYKHLGCPDGLVAGAAENCAGQQKDAPPPQTLRNIGRRSKGTERCPSPSNSSKYRTLF